MKTPNHAITTFVVGISAFVFFVGSYLCYLAPKQAWAWLLAMFMLPFAWVVLKLVTRRGARDVLSPPANREHMQAMALTGSMLAVSLAAALMSRMGWAAGGYAAELSERSWGFLMGAIVVVFANAIPKQTGSARRQAALRIVGWALVLGGLGYAASWLFLPLAYANLVAMLVLLCGTLYAIVRIAGYCVDRRSTTPPPSG